MSPQRSSCWTNSHKEHFPSVRPRKAGFDGVAMFTSQRSVRTQPCCVVLCCVSCSGSSHSPVDGCIMTTANRGEQRAAADRTFRAVTVGRGDRESKELLLKRRKRLAGWFVALSWMRSGCVEKKKGRAGRLPCVYRLAELQNIQWPTFQRCPVFLVQTFFLFFYH